MSISRCKQESTGPLKNLLYGVGMLRNLCPEQVNKMNNKHRTAKKGGYAAMKCEPIKAKSGTENNGDGCCHKASLATNDFSHTNRCRGWMASQLGVVGQQARWVQGGPARCLRYTAPKTKQLTYQHS